MDETWMVVFGVSSVSIACSGGIVPSFVPIS